MDAIPAATLVIVRDLQNAPPVLLMVERSRSLAFAAGAWVFPGGRIDPGDVELAGTLSPALPDAAARVAAIRETVEETGVGIGLSVTAQALPAIRAALHGGMPFGRALADAGATLDIGALVPFARWRPAHRQSRIFDTHFFLARAPDGVCATVDATENTRVAWVSAADMLAHADAGDAAVIYPTRRNLERLALFKDYAAAAADAQAHPVQTIVPVVEQRDGIAHLCIPDGLGYRVTSEPLTDAVRG